MTGTARSDLRRILGWLRPYRTQFIAAGGCLAAATGAGLALPQLVRVAVDAWLGGGAMGWQRAGVWISGTLLVMTAASFARDYLLAWIGERIVADARQQLHAHLLTLPPAFFSRVGVGELASRAGSDIGVLQHATTYALAELLRRAAFAIGGVAFIFLMSPGLTATMLGVIPVLVVAAWAYGRAVRRVSVEAQDHLADANATFEESLSSMRVVQSFVRESFEAARYGRAIERVRLASTRRALFTGLFGAAMTLVVFGALGAIAYRGGTMVRAGVLGVGTLSAFTLYTFSVAMSLSGLAEIYGQLQQAMGALRRVFGLLDTASDLPLPRSPRILERVRGHVEFDRVGFAYADRPDRPVLTNISFTVSPGTSVALVGPSGSGKSTLVSLLSRFADPSIGSVRLDGHDLRELDLGGLRRAVGVVPQEPQLFSTTIADNIAYGRLEASRDDIEAAAEAAHAGGFIRSLPAALDTRLGPGGQALSAGERQRIAIARTLLKDPSVAVLDEPTSALDAESEMLVQDAVSRLMAGRTTFVIAHRLATVLRADLILVLSEGHLVEHGRHTELVRQDGLYRHLWEIQFRHQPSALLPEAR